MADSDKDKRLHTRLKTEVIARYKLLEHAEEDIIDKAEDSLEGVCLVAREKFAVGAHLIIEFNSPDTKHSGVALSRVMWSGSSLLGPSPTGHERFDNGLRFMQVSMGAQEQLTNKIKLKQKESGHRGWKIGIVRDLTKPRA